MVVANLQIGIVGANDVFFTKFRAKSVYGVPIPQKPVLHVFLGYPGARKGSVIDFRKREIGFINALPDEEVETYSTSSLLEKEFKFSPAFDAYVKVLESVKTDRRRITSEDGDGHFQKKKNLSVREKRGLPISQKQRSKGKFYSEERVSDSNYATQSSPNSKRNISGGSSSSWSLVERILQKKANEKGVERRNGRFKTVSEDLNSVKCVRRVSYENVKDFKQNIHDGIFEKKRTSNWMTEDSKGNWLKSTRMDEVDGPKVQKGGIRDGDNGKHKFTRYRAIKDLSVQRNGVHTKIDGVEGVIDNGLWESKIMSGRTAHETKDIQDELSLHGMKKNKHTRGELDYGDFEKKHKRRSRYCDFNDDIMVNKCENLTFSKGSGKPKSSKFDNTFTSDKPVSGKMKDLRMYVNKNYSIKEQNSDLVVSTNETFGNNRRNSNFHGTINAGKNNSRDLISFGNSASTDRDHPDVSGVGIDGVELEDRAAFKTFEVFTDVRNRPRVLRMEMEERIQNLAKWLNASDLNMPEWQFSKMIHSAKIRFSEHSILRIVQILGSFGNWRRVLQVVEWFHSRERFKCYKSRYIYTSALDVLGKAKRPMEALNIFYAMRQELSSYPDLAAYHCISVTLGQAGLMKELFDVIDCMRAAPTKKYDLGPLQKWDPRLNPDIVIYNAVLNACVQQKQWEGAFWVLHELKMQGIRPSSTTYGLIMEVMLACGKYNLVYDFFWKLQKNSIPGALNYKVLVNCLWREGKIEDAVQAVKDMERRGIVGCASLYYDLARCLCSSGRCEEAMLQINKISKVAKKPLVVTYTGLIQACLDSGNFENAAYIFNQMNSFCSPNVITYNVMLKSYVQHGMFDEAKNLFERILSDSHEIKRKDEANQKVFPDKFTFNTMIEACIRANRWDDFEKFYFEMLHHGYHFDERRHMHLVFDAWRAGKKNILEITWNHLTGNDRVPPPAMIKELFCLKIEEDDPASAISFISTHPDMKLEAFSKKAWLNLLRKVQHHSSKTIPKLLNELMRIVSESYPPHPVYQNLLNACEDFAHGLGSKETHSSGLSIVQD